jgi:hypothetical protein
MKSKYAAVLLIIIFLICLTLALRGAMPKTYDLVTVPASAVQTTILSYTFTRTIQGNVSFISDNETFQAVILNLPSEYEPKDGWGLQWLSVTYTLTSNSEFEYSMFLTSNSDWPNATAVGSVFLSHEGNFSDTYRLDASSQASSISAEQFPKLNDLLGSYSILIINSTNLDQATLKGGRSSEGFLTFNLNSVEIMSSKNIMQSSIITLPNNWFFFVTLGIAVAAIMVPFALVLVLNLGQKMVSRNRNMVFFLGGLFAYGCVIRIFLSPFTGHPYDMGVWTQSTNLYFGSGIVTLNLYPFPLSYYFQVLAYAPYALLRVLGFHDMFFSAHTTGMLESVFVKAPFIVCDFIGFFLLYKIFNTLNSVGRSRREGLAYALMYFLGPLVIGLSSLWGLYDSIAVTLFLAGIYYGLIKEKALLGVLFFTLSGLTEGFGFIGLLPLFVSMWKKRKISNLGLAAGLTLGLTFLVYLPILGETGIQGVSAILMQFLMGRAGLGSQGYFIASDSYISYLTLFNFNIEPSYLTYVFFGLFTSVSVLYVLKVRKLDDAAQKLKTIEFSLSYFAAVFFIFYLTFFRVYDQYYIWFLPILFIFAWIKQAHGISLSAAFLSLAAAPIFLLGILTVGAEYYWINLKLPSDTSIISVIPSTIVVLAFLSTLNVKGPLRILKTINGMSVAAGIATWFTFGFAYYGYYGFPFLGLIWYFISLLIVLLGAVFFTKAIRNQTMNSISVGA